MVPLEEVQSVSCFQAYLDMIESYIFPSVFEWVLISLYAVVFIAGVTGNSLVCFAVWR